MTVVERLIILAVVVTLPVAFLPGGVSPFTVAKADAFGILALALFAVRAAGGSAALRAAARSLARGPVAAPAVAVGLLAALAEGFGGSRSGLVGVVYGAGVMLVVASHPGPALPGRVAAAWTAVMAAVATYALAQAAGFDPLEWERSFAGGAPTATLGNPLFLGTALAAALPFGALGWLRAAGPAPVRGAVVLVITVALVATQARGAWLGAGIGLTALFAHPALRAKVFAPMGRRRAWRWGAGILLAAVVFSTGNPLNPAGASVVRHAAGSLDPAHWRGRGLLWEATAGMVRDRPLGGWGIGGVRREYLGYQGRLLALPRYAALPYRSTAHSHNDWLQFGAERGVIGLGAMVWLLVAALRAGLRDGAPAWRRAAGCAVLGWCADGLVNGPLHVPPSAELVWVLLGIAGGGGGPGHRASTPGPVPARSRAPAVALAVAVVVSRPFTRDLAGEGYLGVGAAVAPAADPVPALEALLRADALLREDRRQHFHAGRAWFGAGRYGDAAREFALDVGAHPGVHSGWHNLGLALRAAGRPEDARAAFRRAAALNPRDPESGKLALEPPGSRRKGAL